MDLPKLIAQRFIPPLWFVLFVCSLFVIAIIIATVAAWKNHKRNKRLFGSSCLQASLNPGGPRATCRTRTTGSGGAISVTGRR